MYFLRFTNTPEADLERGTSVHAGAGVDECSKEQMAEMFNCDEEDVIEINGMWHQVLDGLCGYQMEATTLEEAIEEAVNAAARRVFTYLNNYSQMQTDLEDDDQSGSGIF